MKLIEVMDDGKMTGSLLKHRISQLPMDKSTAIQLIAFANVIKGKVDDAKSYLSELPSAATGSFVDPQTGLSVSRTECNRVNISSPKIEKLKAQIKAEEDRIRQGKLVEHMNDSPYYRWTLNG